MKELYVDMSGNRKKERIKKFCFLNIEQAQYLISARDPTLEHDFLWPRGTGIRFKITKSNILIITNKKSPGFFINQMCECPQIDNRTVRPHICEGLEHLLLYNHM